SRLANVLRWLGTGAVASSGVVFLLQGLDGMDAAVRHWSYLALMGLLAACGVGTRALLGDARSARLLLGLAVMLVPIQFAQLGGMLHTLVTGEVTALVALFGLHTSSAWTVAAVAAATALAAPAATFAGFAVLVRPAARTLTWRFILPNTL